MDASLGVVTGEAAIARVIYVCRACKKSEDYVVVGSVLGAVRGWKGEG